MAAVGRYALATALGPAGFLFGLLALNAGLRSLGLPSWSGHESAGLLLWFLILVAYVACTDFVFAAAVAIRRNADERRAGQQGG